VTSDGAPVGEKSHEIGRFERSVQADSASNEASKPTRIKALPDHVSVVDGGVLPKRYPITQPLLMGVQCQLALYSSKSQ
jgi:hypothetical protein